MGAAPGGVVAVVEAAWGGTAGVEVAAVACVDEGAVVAAAVRREAVPRARPPPPGCAGAAGCDVSALTRRLDGRGARRALARPRARDPEPRAPSAAWLSGVAGSGVRASSLTVEIVPHSGGRAALTDMASG
jgi:hypothetical protein